MSEQSKKYKTTKSSTTPSVVILDHKILTFRKQRVMLDSDLAELYGVTTTRLNEQVKRNESRFPEEFAFRLSDEEFAELKSLTATSKGQGGRRKVPLVFTEHGALMAANVLHSPTAVEMSARSLRP